MLENIWPVSTPPFLVLQIVASELQGLLEEADFLVQFQSGFRPGFGTNTALVTLFDDLYQELDRGNGILLSLLDYQNKSKNKNKFKKSY